MQQRRLRLGDTLDDYCSRERRVTNHVVVAMVEDEVKQTRCTTCDTEHEYKEARVPLSRRRKPADAHAPAPPAHLLPGSPRDDEGGDDEIRDGDVEAAEVEAAEGEADGLSAAEIVEDEGEGAPAAEGEDRPESQEEDWPVHRPLIRATLPRPEGQSPERKAPDFTIRQSGGRFDANRNGGRQRGRPRQAQGGPRQTQGGPGGGPARFGTRQGTGHGHPQRQGQGGNRPGGNAAGGRGGRPQGPNRGPRPGGGDGRKRGR